MICGSTFVVFQLQQGATFSAPVTLLDASRKPVDLTGCAATLQARREISDPIPVFALDSATGGIVLGGPDGTITLSIPAAITARLPIGWEGELWRHDLLLTMSDGTVQRAYQGVIVASPGVTRAV